MSFDLLLDWKKCRWLKKAGFEVLTEDVIREVLPVDDRVKRYGVEEVKKDFQLFRRYKGSNVQIYSIRYLSETPLKKLKEYHRKNLK